MTGVGELVGDLKNIEKSAESGTPMAMEGVQKPLRRAAAVCNPSAERGRRSYHTAGGQRRAQLSIS